MISEGLAEWARAGVLATEELRMSQVRTPQSKETLRPAKPSKPSKPTDAAAQRSTAKSSNLYGRIGTKFRTGRTKFRTARFFDLVRTKFRTGDLENPENP